MAPPPPMDWHSRHTPVSAEQTIPSVSLSHSLQDGLPLAGRLKALRLVVVLLGAGEAAVSKDLGGDADVLGILDGDRGRRAVAEQVRIDALAKCGAGLGD